LGRDREEAEWPEDVLVYQIAPLFFLFHRPEKKEEGASEGHKTLMDTQPRLKRRKTAPPKAFLLII